MSISFNSPPSCNTLSATINIAGITSLPTHNHSPSRYSHSLEKIENNEIEDHQILKEYNKLQNKSSKFKCDINGDAPKQDYKSVIGFLPTNKSKNRYRDIVPYDKNKTTTSNDEYFNGSFIQFPENSQIYIATQAPLPQTFNDFWDVVFHSNSNTIVMLTKLFEKKIPKAHCYWPSEIGDRDEFLSITVEFLDEVSDSSHLNIKKFKLIKGEESRIVTHYHFLEWDDQGVTDVANLNALINKVDSSHCSSSPIIVHCSAGVGRAGTYIAINALMHDIQKNNKKLSVYKKVKELRAQRRGCIQKYGQYVLIFKALSHYLNTIKNSEC